MLAVAAVVPVAWAVEAVDADPQPSPSAVTEDEMSSQQLSLPARPGPAPEVTTGIPHIQLDQTSDAETYAALVSWAFSLPSVVERASAASLPGALGLTLADDVAANDDAMIVGREFAHIHADPGTGSLHLRLSPDEAPAVVETGWGEWHPFALDGSMPGLVMVYAPRDADDLEALKLIIAASVEHATASVG